MSTSLFVPLCTDAPGTHLHLASALVAAHVRMLAAAGLPDLWPIAADEAMKVIESDGVAVVCRRDNAWALLGDRSIPPDWVVLATEAESERILDRVTVIRPAHARSCVVAALSAPMRGADLRVMWFAARSAAMGSAVPVAELFARHVELAAQTVGTRGSLNEAVAARHHIGMAQGVLMSRYGLTADQAFAVLRRHSQDSNVKVRTIAEEVLRTGRLPRPTVRN